MILVIYHAVIVTWKSAITISIIIIVIVITIFIVIVVVIIVVFLTIIIIIIIIIIIMAEQVVSHPTAISDHSVILTPIFKPLQLFLRSVAS